MDKTIIGLLSGASALALMGGARPRLPLWSPQVRSPSSWTLFRTRLNFSTRTTSARLQTLRPMNIRSEWRSIITTIIIITTITITTITITITTTTTTNWPAGPALLTVLGPTPSLEGDQRRRFAFSVAAPRM